MPVKNGSLFKIGKLEHHESTIHASLNINKDSDIFSGHFPGHPVVPGACMLQIVKDVLETGLSISICLKKADYLKFMMIIDPQNTQAAQLDLSYKFVDGDLIIVNAKLITGDIVCFKFQGAWIPAGK
jgi:3-hydroxyacyl-[acyl-carrier-protein] dehydratase